jgi:uncharacterized coiled-coil protein SlyX
MGRKPVGVRALTPAEKQAAYRARKQAANPPKPPRPADRVRELAARDARIDKLETALAARNARIDELETALAAREAAARKGELQPRRTVLRKPTAQDKLREDNRRLRAQVADLQSALKEVRAASTETDGFLRMRMRVKNAEAELRDNRIIMRGMIHRTTLDAKQRAVESLSARDMRKIARAIHPDTSALIIGKERDEAASIFLNFMDALAKAEKKTEP